MYGKKRPYDIPMPRTEAAHALQYFLRCYAGGLPEDKESRGYYSAMLEIEEGICMNSRAPQFNPHFNETMLRSFGDVCRAVDSAYIHCYEYHKKCGTVCGMHCPWRNPDPREPPCRVMTLKGMGFIVAPDHIEREEAEGMK
jgi:hypothetical protein